MPANQIKQCVHKILVDIINGDRGIKRGFMSKTRRNNNKKRNREKTIEKKNLYGHLDLTAYDAVKNIVKQQRTEIIPSGRRKECS